MVALRVFGEFPRNKALKQIARINFIAGTPTTAFKLGPLTKKVELMIVHKNAWGASLGLKRFWQLNLPTLKFHNDDVEFVVTKVRATLKEEIAKAPTKIIVHDANTGSKEINCAHKDSSDILAELVKTTNATSVPEEEIPRV